MWRRTVLVVVGLVVLGLVFVPSAAHARGKSHKPHTLLRVSGAGFMRTRTFHAPRKWQLHYSFDCHASGIPGGIGIAVRRSPNSVVASFASPRAWNGKGTEHLSGSGTVWLDIISRCNWKVTATT
jgi:hypothetical protein